MRPDHGTPRRVLEVTAAAAANPAPHHHNGALHPPRSAATARAIAAPTGALARTWAAQRPWLVLEFLAVFILLPALPVLGLLPVTVIPALLLVAGLCLVVLLNDSCFDRRSLGLGPGHSPGARAVLRRMALWFAGGAAIMTAGVILFDGDSLFRLIKNRPAVWATIMIAYPVLSVYPQEIIFRTFLFHRYRDLFRGRWAMIIASALTFGYVHIVLGNWVAVALSTVGGFIFALTYDRTRSTLLTALEHTLYGCFIFTIGMGAYFYHGTARAVEMISGAP